MNAYGVITSLFMLLCLYSMQYWAKRCFDELRDIKAILEEDRRP